MDLGADRRARSAPCGAYVLRRRLVSLRSQIRRALEPPGVSPYDAVRLGNLAMRTRVKICGITRVEDTQAAAAHGADAIGLIFYRPSPRCVTLAQARAIAASTPPFVATVAGFVNPAREDLERVNGDCRVALLQLPRDRPAGVSPRFPRPDLKASRILPGP